MKLFYFILFSALLSFASRLMGDGGNNSWAQTTLEKMSLEEKIGQLFMIAAYVDPEYAGREIGNPRIIEETDHFITHYHVGGLAFVGPSTCIKQVILTNHYQEISKYPLLIAQDLEWGLSMRIADGMRFPKNITLGAFKDNHLIYEMGKEVGRQAKLIGVQMNLSPVLDVNIESENIAINVRSFGSSPQQVSEKGIAMICGLQDAGIIASAKHFPGLGDIAVDPHLGLPFCRHDKKRLQEVELTPFVQAIKAGVLSIQTEHLIVPALDPSLNTPSSLSKKVITDLLKNELGFNGLVLSGALRMKALTDYLPENEIVLKAFIAGNDMLLMPQDFPRAYQIIKMAVAEGKITEKDINERVLKILQLKEKVQLDSQRTVNVPFMDQLHSPFAKALKKRLYENALTVVRSNLQFIPSLFQKQGSIAYVQIGEASSSHYFDQLCKRFFLDSFILPLGYGDPIEMEGLFKKMENYSHIILAVYPADPRRIEKIRLLDAKERKEELKHFRVHGMSESLVKFLNAFQPHEKKTIVTFFGNPFGLHFFDRYSTLIMAYEDDPDAEQAAAEFLVGQLRTQ